MLILKDLTYRYSTGTEALDNVSVSLCPGIYLLLGENGAGKTTLLHVLSGLLFPSSGTAILDNTSIATRTPKVMNRIFFLADNMNFPAPTINEMAKIHAPFYPNFNPQMLRENLEAFGMTGDEKLQQLSLGNSQKAKIAYALALQPSVLLLDEPANGLDISSRQELTRLMMRNTPEEMTVIVSTHTVWDFQNIVDGVMFLHKGNLVLSETINDLCEAIAFTVSPAPADDALYQEIKLGQYHSIVANTEGMFTDVDYALLYCAMMREKSREAILSTLNHEE